MNNENNNLNGNVLGSTQPVQPNPTPTPNEIPNPGQSVMPTTPEVDSLNTSTPLGSVEPLNNNVNNNVNPTPTAPVQNSQDVIPNGSEPITGGTFFNEPVNNGALPNQNPMANNGMNNNIGSVPPIENNQPLGSTPIEPMPSFSNPQSVVPGDMGSMPSFENPNQIGTTPPISLDAEPEPKKQPKKNKFGFIIIIVVVLAFIGFGTYYVLNYTNLLKNGATTTIKITTKNLEVNVGDKLPEDINEYADITGTNNPASCSVDKSSIDMNTAGVYEFTVTCGGTRQTGVVTVVDNRELEVSLKDVYKAVGETLEAKEFASEENTDLVYEFVNETEVKNDLNAAGEYDVNIKVTDSKTTKTKEITAKLYVTASDITSYLVCTTETKTLTDINATYTSAERFGIANVDNSFVYGGLAFRENRFVLTNEEDFNNYQTKYNTDKELTINNITSKNVTFDSETKTITFSDKLNNTDLYSSYGEETFNTYSGMRNYFGNLGRTCVIER